MSGFKSTTWMPAVQWPATARQRYLYWAEGRADDLRGVRTWVEVKFTAGSDPGCSIDATWRDDAGCNMIHVLADVGMSRSTLSYVGPSGPLAQAVAELDEGRVHVERSCGSGDYALSAGLPFHWRLVWPLAIQFAPWRAGLAGALSLFDLATASGSPFGDGPTTADMATENGEAMVAAPDGGQQSVACWMITARGPAWSEVAWVGKAGEGLVRFDLHSADSAILMGRAG